MDYIVLSITSLISGMIIGALSRIERIRPFIWIFGIGTIITLFSYAFYIINYTNNPTLNGLYSFIYSVIPFVISTAFSSKGEEIIQNLIRR